MTNESLLPVPAVVIDTAGTEASEHDSAMTRCARLMQNAGLDTSALKDALDEFGELSVHRYAEGAAQAPGHPALRSLQRVHKGTRVFTARNGPNADLPELREVEHVEFCYTDGEWQLRLWS